MPDREWADDFNYERFCNFKYESRDSQLQLSDKISEVWEFLRGATQCRDLAMDFKPPKPREDSQLPEARRLRRNSVDECSRAIQCITDRFLDTFKLCYQFEESDKIDRREAESKNTEILNNAKKFGNAYKASRDWPISFPERLEALVHTGVLRHPQAVEKVNRLRNCLVHRYETPSLEEVNGFLSVAELYCKLLRTHFEGAPEKFYLSSDYDERLELFFRPQEGTIWYKYEMNSETLELAEQAIKKDEEIQNLKRELKESGGNSSNVASSSIDSRHFLNVVKSSAPSPVLWEGEVQFTDVQRYRNWLSVILAYSGRT
jgi:hypothetical protein